MVTVDVGTKEWLVQQGGLQIKDDRFLKVLP
jgi:hypothetical protein